MPESSQFESIKGIKGGSEVTGTRGIAGTNSSSEVYAAVRPRPHGTVQQEGQASYV
jgi:hypothetical protein